ncbi:exonuclease mut-7 homolog [Culicoides brevitarsis]|uniref:exonuclease mut-7 homolog n=1 Tax=Culicoides brevitarsis TaxID=469753 RepID=UPI00307C23F2
MSRPAGLSDSDDEEYFGGGGKIRIVKGLGHQARLNKEDFDINLTPDVQQWLSNFTRTFNTYKKGPVVSQGIRMFLATRNDLHEIVLKLYANLPGSSNPKSGTLACTLIKEFEAFLTSLGAAFVAEIKKTLTDDLKMVAFNFFYSQSQLFGIVCDCYDLKASRQLFVARIRELITEQKYKDACQSACDLQLYGMGHFSIHDFLVPLILQDKMSVAEKYLAADGALQRELVTFLDTWLDHRQSLSHFTDNYLAKNDIAGINYSKLQRKTLKKLVKRYADMYNIPKELTPYLGEMDAYGMLQLMLNKKYVERSLKDWDEYIRETVLPNSGRLIDELICACCDYNDVPEAAKWAKFFAIDTQTLPHALQEYLKREKMSPKLSKITAKDESEEDFYENYPSYSIEMSKILVVTTVKHYYRMIGELARHDVVGFDCEWKFGETEIDLIQLASKEKVYLIDVKTLKNVLSPDDWRILGRKIFRNEEILKLGFSQASDVAMIRKTLPDLCINYEKTTSYIDLQKLWRFLAEYQSFKLPFVDNAQGHAKQDLRQLTNLCLGRPLDKNQQFSNWAKRPLTKEQIQYAAADAACLLEIFDVMKREANRLKVDLNDYDLCKKLK